MEHRLRRKQLNSDTYASNKTHLKEIQEKRKEETFFLRKMKINKKLKKGKILKTKFLTREKKGKEGKRGTSRDGSKKCYKNRAALESKKMKKEEKNN